MRYAKVLLIVLIFFISMVFFFQNQTVLSTEMVLNLNLFFIKPMASIPLPFYFLVLGAFLAGALAAMLALVWDKVQLSTKLMKATWRVRALEKEVQKLNDTLEKQSTTLSILDNKPGATKLGKHQKPSSSAKGDSSEYDDITAPDPDKQF